MLLDDLEQIAIDNSLDFAGLYDDTTLFSIPAMIYELCTGGEANMNQKFIIENKIYLMIPYRYKTQNGKEYEDYKQSLLDIKSLTKTIIEEIKDVMSGKYRINNIYIQDTYPAFDIEGQKAMVAEISFENQETY